VGIASTPKHEDDFKLWVLSTAWSGFGPNDSKWVNQCSSNENHPSSIHPLGFIPTLWPWSIYKSKKCWTVCCICTPSSLYLLYYYKYYKNILFTIWIKQTIKQGKTLYENIFLQVYQLCTSARLALIERAPILYYKLACICW
jgi:hypothetical protein